MSNKNIKKIFKNTVISLVVLATIFWTIGPVLLRPRPVKAAVTTSVINDMVPSGFMAGPGMTIPGVGINVAADSGETLQSVIVKIVIPAGSAFVPSTGLAALATGGTSGVVLLKDNKSAGAIGYLDPPDNMQDTVLTLASVPSWTQIDANNYSTTLTLATADAVPANDSGSNSGNDYFVALKTSDTPEPDSTFKVQIPAGGVTVDSTTFPVSASPASPNIITIGKGGMTGFPVAISEVSIGKAGAAKDEFIELYNRSDMAMDLSGLYLHLVASDATDTNMTLTRASTCDADNINVGSGSNPCTHIPANGFYLIAAVNESSYTPDATYDDTVASLVANAGLYISFSATADLDVKDRLGWGTAQTGDYEGAAAVALADDGKSLERKAFSDSTITSMTTGMDSGMGNGFDSENNANDFILRDTAGAQNSASTAENPDASGANPVVINEVYYNNTSSANQWVELYNNDTNAQDITGWKLKAAGSAYIFGSVSVPATSYMVVNWNSTGTDSATEVYTGTGVTAMSKLAGDVFLTDATDAGEDYVQYGASGQTNESTAVGDNEWATGDYVPGVLQGQSIGRGNNGYDTNHAYDWQTFTSPTKKAANSGGDNFAPDPVTNVQLTDPDSANFGIDGRDVTVGWTPASADATFDKYVIYLLPAVTALDPASHSPFAEIFGAQSTATFTGSISKTTDSAGNALATGSYKAYVRAVDRALNKSSPTSSAAATLTAEDATAAGTDTIPPMIMAMPVWTAKDGTDTIIVAHVGDDRDLHATTPTQLKWRVSGGSWQTAVGGTEAIAGTGIYKYVLPWEGTAAPWTAGTTQIDYYLLARDTSDNYTFFTTDPDFDTASTSHDAADEDTAKTKAFLMDFAAAAGYTRTISGTVYDSAGAALSSAGVAIPGSGLDVVTTGAGGTYSFTVADGTYTVAAFKSGYMQGWIDGVSAIGANSTGNDFYLSTGYSGTGGNMEKPFVKWTDPFDGMMGAPTDISLTGMPIVAHVSKALDATTINDLDATDAGSNVYLTITGEDRITGSATYDGSDSVDLKIKFYSSTALTGGQTYYFVIKPAVADENGNSIEGNQPDGKYVSSFTTFSEVSFEGAGAATYGQVEGFPPYVTGSMPGPGGFNIPINTKITVNFSEAMDASTIEATSSTGLNVKLYDTGLDQYVTLNSVSLDAATRKVATINAGTLTANHGYAIRVLGGAVSSKGVSMGNPGMADYQTQVFYQADFTTGATADTGAPSVIGTNLQRYEDPTNPGCNITTKGCIIGVPTNVGVIRFGFDKDMDSSTINTTNVTLKLGNTAIGGTVSYDAMNRKGSFAISAVLNAKNTYLFTIGTGVKAANGTALASAYKVTFTTSDSVDTSAPFVMFGRATEQKMSVTFSEPMNAAPITNSTQWSTSVLNPANYILYIDDFAPWDPVGNVVKYYSCDNLGGTNCGAGAQIANLRLTYDAESNTVTMEGLKLETTVPGVTMNGGFRLWVMSVKDFSGNAIAGVDATAGGFDANLATNMEADNAAAGPIEHMHEVGMMGPGMGGMMGPPPSDVMGGTYSPTEEGMMMAKTDFGGKDPGAMGMMPVGVWPMNMLANAQTKYMIDLAIRTDKAIPAGGKIILTFTGDACSGINVSGAKNADPNAQFVHYDINGPGTGTVVLATSEGTLPSGAATGGAANDGVYVVDSSTTPQIVIILGGVATQAPDFVHIEIDGIKNPDAVESQTSSAGCSSNIKIEKSGRKIDEQDAMPFFVKAGGTSTLTGAVAFKQTDGTTAAPVTITSLLVYLDSPMTGPQKQELSFTNSASETYTFRNLPTGEYMLFTEPLQSSGAKDYYSSLTMFEPIYIAAGSNTKNITFTEQGTANKAKLTVYLIGTFSSQSIDIFAGGPSGFIVKTVTVDGIYTAGSPDEYSLYLPSTGMWMIGMGPAMPKGMEVMAPKRESFSWMPPKPVEVSVSGTPGSWTWKDHAGAATADNANDGKVSFSITSASKTIVGHVQDATGNALANVEVFAYSPMGGFGNHAQSGSDGSFSINVTAGLYKVGAFMPGMPPSQEVAVEVKDSTMYVNGLVSTDVIVKLAKPDYYISGLVSDGTNVIKDASVFAHRTDGPGHAETMTDSMGKYILYVSPGTWNINVFLPGYGELTAQTKTITNASVTDVDFAPSAATTYHTVEERVYEDKSGGTAGQYDDGVDSPLANAHVVLKGSNGYVNTAMTNADGIYKTKVPAGTYDIEVFSPTKGNLPTQEDVAVVADIDKTGAADVPIPETKTITINFKDSGGSAVTVDKAMVQLDKIGTKNVSNDKIEKDVSSIEIDVPSGTGYEYVIDIDIPGIPDENIVATAGGAGTTVTANDVDGDATNDIYKVGVDGNETITVTLPDLRTVSGTVKDQDGAAVADAVVHIEQPGTDVEFDVQADSSGNYTVKLPDSNGTAYLIQADKAGYVDTSGSLTITGDTSSADLSTTKATLKIEGQVKIGASGAERAQVTAKKLGAGSVTVEADTSGNYTLNVTPGDWKVFGAGEGYQEKQYTDVVNVSTADVASIDVTLDAAKTGLAERKGIDVSSASGKAIDRTADADLEVSIPSSALKTRSHGFDQTYQIQAGETSNIASSDVANVIGGEAFSISGSYNAASGNSNTLSGGGAEPINELNKDIMIDKVYTKATLATAGLDTFAEVENIKMSTFDGTAQNWTSLPTTITYLDSNDAPVIPADSTLSNVSKVIINGAVDHFTVFSPTNPTPDGLAPSSPTSLAGSAISGQVQLSWTAPTTNSDGTALTDLLGYEIYRSTSPTGTYTQINTSDILTTSYSDTSVTNGTTYYYKVTAADTGGIESAMSSASQGLTPTSPGGAAAPAPAPAPAPAEEVVEEEVVEEEVVEEEAVEEVVEEEEVVKPISEMTVVELKAEIARIAALIAQLQAELAVLLKEVVIEGVPAGFSFEVTLEQGMIGDEVKYLQIVLNSAADTRLAETGVGSPGNETNYFGLLTKAAVVKFQEKYSDEVLAPWNLTQGTGFVGRTTRAKLNALLGR